MKNRNFTKFENSFKDYLRDKAEKIINPQE